MSHKDLNTIRQSLSQTKLFSSLPKDIIFKLAQQTEEIHLIAGETLFSQGSVSDFLYILIKGKLISTHISPSGTVSRIGKINPIETVGELGVFSGEPRSLTVNAIIDSYLYKIPTKQFNELCHTYPVLFEEISKLIIDRSYGTIKSLTREKVLHHVMMILPLLKNQSIEFIRNQFEKTKRDEINFFSCQGLSHEIITDIINHHDENEQSVLFFMEEWMPTLFKSLSDKLTHCYIALSVVEECHLSNETKEILNYIEHYTNINLQLILIHPDNQAPINTQHFLDIAEFELHHHIRLNHIEDYKRIMRFMTGTALAVVLGGGGARGLTHLGVLKAIVEQGIPIDAIGGTSIGASVAACFAITQDFSYTADYVNRLKEATLRSLKMWHITWPIISVYSGNPTTVEINGLVGNTMIEDLWIPYFAVSSDLSEKIEVVHKRGLLWEAMRSSGSIPAIFPPVVRNGHLLIDGGVMNNLPVDVMRRLIGNKHIILASSLSKRFDYENKYNFPTVLPLSMTLLHRLGLGKKKYVYPEFFRTFIDALLLGSSANEKKNANAADILVSPDLFGFNSLSIPKKREIELINRGYDETIIATEKFMKHHPGFRK